MSTNVAEFYCRTLRNGDARTVAVLSGGKRPCVALSVFRDRKVLTRSLFFPEHLDVLEPAIVAALDLDKLEPAAVKQGDVELHVWATPAALHLQRRQPNGRTISNVTRLFGAELEALDKAVAFLRRLVASEAAEVER